MKASNSKYCHVCGVLFGIGNPKKLCASCNLPVCKEHIKNLGGICDFCYKQFLISNYQFTNKALGEKLRVELRDISKENQNNSIVLQDQESKLKSLQSTLKTIIEKMGNLQAGYEEKINKETERNGIFLENFTNLKRSNDELISAEESLKVNIERCELELTESKNKIEILKQEKINLCTEIAEARLKAENCLPLKVIKSKICKLCLHKFEYLYRSSFSGKMHETITIRPCCCNLI